MSTAAVKPPRRFPPPCWTQDEALALIQAYRDRWYALRRGYLRTADWDAVAEDVGRICPGAMPPKTSAQCRHKMEKLRQRYRAEKQRAISFAGGHFISTWFYFEPMDSMEKNGNESNQSNQSGMDIKPGLNTGRGIRFKPGPNDNNLVTVASRSNNFRLPEHEDNDNDNDNEEFEENDYYVGKNQKLLLSSSQNYQDFEGVRPRKFSKTGLNGLNGSSHGYMNENGEERDNVYDEDDAWVKMPKDRSSSRYYDGESEKRGVKRENDSIGEIVSSIKLLADGFVKTEKMKMDMVREIEKMRMEAEMKRNEMLLESQKQIVEAFVKGLAENKKLG